MLTKPSGAVSHKGGVRFNVNSPAYKILSTWIAQGAIGPTNADLAITKVQILPGTITSRPGDRQMVKVHRVGMISVGLHAREFFEIDFWSFLDPPNRGYFEGGAGISTQI